MKSVSRILSCFGWLVLGILAVRAETKEEMVRIYSRMTTNGVREFFVPASRFLAPTNSWKPSQGDFPVDLREFTDRAKARVMKETGHSLIALRSIHAELVWRNRVAQDGFALKITGTDECWAIAFDFGTRSVTNSNPISSVDSPALVVMLLDGTIAEER